MIFILSQKRKEKEDCFKMNTDNQPRTWVKAFAKEWDLATGRLKKSGYDLSKVILIPGPEMSENRRRKYGTFRAYEKDIKE